MIWLDELQTGAFIAITHFLGLIAAFHALRYTRTSQGAVAWAVSLLSIPYITLIPYLFLGSSRFIGYAASRRRGDQHIRSRRQQRGNTTPFGGCAQAQEEQSSSLSAQTVHTLTALSQMSVTSENQIRLLINGKQTFAAIFAAIAQATDYIVVQFFVVRDDRLGRQLKEALLARASAGVRVYFLYDGIGSYDLSKQYLAALRAGGIDIRKFATRRFVNRFQLNFRNHRKVVVVDGQCAFVGGHNVGVEYLGEKAQCSPWRDTHIEIRGPAVADIQSTFAADWYWATQQLPIFATPLAVPGGCMDCLVLPSGPADRYETGSLLFVAMINAARSRLWISTPYFVPDEAVFAALQLAVMRGVDVRILLPGKQIDNYVTFAASTLYAHDAIHAKIKIFRYQPGFLHQKTILIDQAAAAIGSANLDNRSFRLNFELMVLTLHAGFAAEVASMLEADFALSAPVALTEFACAPAWKRATMHIARLFSPIL
jgi:cardiolipin synthase A/B